MSIEEYKSKFFSIEELEIFDIEKVDIDDDLFDYWIITKYKSDSKKVIIPNYITHIGNEVFKDLELDYLEIPLTIMEIGKDALKNTKIKKLNFKGDIRYMNSLILNDKYTRDLIEYIKKIAQNNKLNINYLDSLTFSDELTRDLLLNIKDFVINGKNLKVDDNGNFEEY